MQVQFFLFLSIFGQFAMVYSFLFCNCENSKLLSSVIILKSSLRGALATWQSVVTNTTSLRLVPSNKPRRTCAAKGGKNRFFTGIRQFRMTNPIMTHIGMTNENYFLLILSLALFQYSSHSANESSFIILFSDFIISSIFSNRA